MEAVLKLISQYEILQKEIECLHKCPVEKNTMNLLSPTWKTELSSSESYKIWQDPNATLDLIEKPKNDNIFQVYKIHNSKKINFITAGVFYYQRSVLKDGKKQKDFDRMEYQAGSDPLEDLKKCVSAKMKLEPVQMINLYLNTCNNACEVCRKTLHLSKENKFCLKNLRLFDGDYKIKPVSSAYLDVYYSSKPFTAIVMVSIDTIIKMQTTFKLAAHCDYMLILPDYVIKQMPSIDSSCALIPDAEIEESKEDILLCIMKIILLSYALRQRCY